MKLRSKAPILRDWQGTGHMTTKPPDSPDGSPVLVVDDPVSRVVGPVEAYGYGYEIMEATDNELELLRKGGYGIPYLGQ
jgi:hypothetical protein